MGTFISVWLECQSINAWGALPLSVHNTAQQSQKRTMSAFCC